MIIYLIRNIINGKIYIGKTERTFDARWKSHCYDAFNGNNKSYFHNAIKKYGVNSFERKRLATAKTREEIDKLEIYFIAKYNSTDPKIGYNGSFGGTGGKLTEQARMKLSLFQKGRKHKPTSDETKKKISMANTGKIRSEETRKKISKIHSGKIVSEESKQKMRDSKKGRVFTQEWKDKISISLKGRVFTQEWKDKISEANKNKNHSEESKLKMSKSKIGNIPWNKGLTKETDERVKMYALSISKSKIKI